MLTMKKVVWSVERRFFGQQGCLWVDEKEILGTKINIRKDVLKDSFRTWARSVPMHLHPAMMRACCMEALSHSLPELTWITGSSA